MNKKMILHILGKMMGVEALLLLLPAFVGLLYGEACAVWFVVTAAVLFVFFLLTGLKKPQNPGLYGKDGLFIVSSAWILWSLFGALPFFLSGSIPNYMDAFFETVSGFTTTGSTILRDVEVLPRCMTFWRSFTHWVGGMGVLVFVMVLTNLDKQSSIHLMRAEVPGPEKDKLVPKARETAQILYGMYFVLTVVLAVLLMLGGMDLFDSLLHAFGTAGTGGFSNYADSVGHFDSAYLDGVITVFMILFGVNFNVYFLFYMRKPKEAFRCEEARWYLAIIAASTLIITFFIRDSFENLALAFHHAAFQVGTIITTTGFATVDFNLWPAVPRTILVTLMLIGACAGSTGGGIKVSRIVILFKSVLLEMRRNLHPNVIQKVKFEGHVMERTTLRSVMIFFAAYAFIFAVSTLLIAVDNYDLTTNFTAVAATLNNIGPGLELVGPTQNFGHFSTFSKLVLTFDMLAGRLEIFPLLLLFHRDTWRRF